MNDKRIGIDFDGVIHSYEDGWQDGTIYGVPIHGFREAIARFQAKGYECVILTARTDHEAIREWLKKWSLPELEITNTKLPCFMYIDDRAVRFTTWKDMQNYVP